LGGSKEVIIMGRMQIVLISIILSQLLLACQRDQNIHPTSSKIPSDTRKPTFTLTHSSSPSLTITPSLTNALIPSPSIITTSIGGGIGKFVFEYGAGIDVKIGVIDLLEPNNKLIIGDNMPANSPSWSPYYERLYFSAKLNNEKETEYKLYSSNIDGSDIKPVIVADDIKLKYIDISPDGTKVIAWILGKVNEPSILYKGEFDGNNIYNLTRLHDGGFPSFSPDGLKVIFSLGYDLYTYNIYVINLDGTKLTNLSAKTNADVFAVYPSWSPDGTKIVYYTDRDNNPAIYEINTDGSNLQILQDKGCNPKYSPDGKLIAFTTDGIYCWGNIYVMNNDGSNVVQLINCLDNCRNPIWISTI
jgi:Tol biopolymer transport system component